MRDALLVSVSSEPPCFSAHGACACQESIDRFITIRKRRLYISNLVVRLGVAAVEMTEV